MGQKMGEEEGERSNTCFEQHSCPWPLLTIRPAVGGAPIPHDNRNRGDQALHDRSPGWTMMRDQSPEPCEAIWVRVESVVACRPVASSCVVGQLPIAPLIQGSCIHVDHAPKDDSVYCTNSDTLKDRYFVRLHRSRLHMCCSVGLFALPSPSRQLVLQRLDLVPEFVQFLLLCTPRSTHFIPYHLLQAIRRRLQTRQE